VSQRFTARQRLRSRPQFQRLYDRGIKVHGRYITVFVLPCPEGSPGPGRLGIAATRRFGGAVERNRAKRRIRELFRARQDQVAGLDIVVVPKRGFGEASGADLERDYLGALARAARRPGRVGGDRAER